MQIDFHHAVTYVVARIAGFNHKQANIISYSAQYVDDATNSGLIKFINGAMYSRISSAHKMLDYRNSNSLKNSLVWIPFHFLPGNGGFPAGEDPTGKEFIKKIICSPNSPVAQDMVTACIKDWDKPYSLHRLGITMHVYADTWAHQGFAGIDHAINEATKIRVNGNYDIKFGNRMTNFFVSKAMPLGHGAVLSYPDKPYLKWSYRSPYLKKRITRDNPADFLVAAEQMCKAMQRFRARNYDAEVPGFSEHSDDKDTLEKLLRTIKNENGDKRHTKWVKSISDGMFSFGRQNVSYAPRGKRSWKYTALGIDAEVEYLVEEFKWNDAFLKCNWKYFHDALQAHRFAILHDVLPRYGIQVA